MRYNELKKQMEKLGFQTHLTPFGDIDVYNKDPRFVATIDRGYQLRINLRGSLLTEFQQPNGKRAFEIMIEYARTPIADRRDEI